jgi:hypothetical protein
MGSGPSWNNSTERIRSSQRVRIVIKTQRVFINIYCRHDVFTFFPAPSGLERGMHGEDAVSSETDSGRHLQGRRTHISYHSSGGEGSAWNGGFGGQRGGLRPLPCP